MNKTRTFKKLLSLVMVLLMVVSTMVIMPLTTSAEVTGDGSEDTPYEASNFEELQAVVADIEGRLYDAENNPDGDLVDGAAVSIVLNGDIAVTQSSFNLPGSFALTLEGNGHTISNLRKTLISKVNYATTIQNLTFKECQLTQSSGNYFGIVVGRFVADLTLNNVIVANDCWIKVESNTLYGGALVGYSADGGNLTLNNCVSAATVTSGGESLTAKRLGGLLGYYKGSSGKVSIKNSAFVGSLTAHNYAAVQYWSGLVGEMNLGTLEIQNCINAGTVDGSLAYKTTRVAGAVGNTNSKSKVTINNFINAGAVKGINASFTSAVCGYASALHDITNCVNTAAITVSDASMDAMVNTAETITYDSSTWYNGSEAIAENQNAVNAIYNAIYSNPNIAQGSGNLSARIKLAGGYGFMLLAKVPAQAWATADEVGFYVDGVKRSGKVENGKIVVTVDNALVVDLDHAYDVAAYFIVDGIEYKSDLREGAFNPFNLVDALAKNNGVYNGQTVTKDETEIALYVAMVEYFYDYKAWAEQ